jgi:hypothetical protein
MRQADGYQLKKVMSEPLMPTIRVPVLESWTNRGPVFGAVDFVHSGQHTVDGLPVYQSGGNVWNANAHG